ncbi:General secretion pathway protein L [Brevundimonas diminuta 3F5N]|uniref:General secretion pathway protein L n=1 Tax=Brevundimonas diminuta 3F5N TaxID=1255603 RepID=A0A1R4FSX5_BREDI|nr:type II secretion system protein GspL [Brevundimonas diminuta]SJM58989.1 General secretion pathway protein L [Brevundimonas diminuta 3F5N]
MSHARILFIPTNATLPARFLLVDREGRVVGRGELDPHQAEAPPPLRTIAVAPGADVMTRWLELPPGNMAQARAAARWALRDQAAGEVEGLDVALGAPADGGPRLTAAVSAKLLQAWLRWMETFDIRPEAVVPDNLCLPAPLEAETLTAAQVGADVALRGVAFAATVQADLAEAIATGRALDWLEGEALDAALAAGALGAPVDLLQVHDRRERGQAVKGWRLAAGLAAALLISPLVLMAAEGLRDRAAAERAGADAKAGAVKLYPELATADDPAPEALRRLDAGAPPGGTARALAAVFVAVERVPGAEVDDATLGGEGLRVTLAHPTFNDLDAVRADLAEAGLAVVDETSAEEAGRMVSTLTIGAAR